MSSATRSFLVRATAACAGAAILAGGTFATAATAETGPSAGASATAGAGATPGATASTTAAPSATASATSAAPAAGQALPGGLAAAVKRDLHMSVEQFNAQGTLAAEAAAIKGRLAKTDPSATVSLADGHITILTSDAAAALKAAAGVPVTIKTTAPAAPPAKADATSVDALFADYVKTFGIRGLMSVAQDTTGAFVIRTKAADGTTTPVSPFARSAAVSVKDFAAKYGNVTVKPADGPAKTHFAPGDPYSVVGGQGYFAHATGDNAGDLCSIGWNAFTKAGKPAVLSAGHCSADGKNQIAELTNPANDDAAGPNKHFSTLTPLGTFGFSQFGGPGNSTTTLDGNGNPLTNIGTDVSVIDNIAANLTQLPKVAHWSNAAAWNPATPGQIAQDPANVAVTGVGDPVLGAKICKSGRTTGWTCGTIDEIGDYAIAGINYDPNTNPTDIRAIRGFASYNGMRSDSGDSGGAVISGTTAVGMLTGGGQMPDGTWGAVLSDLKPALAATDGYTLKILVSQPALKTSGPIYRGATITGTVAGAPTDTTVALTIAGQSSTAVVGANGSWTAKAPAVLGPFTLTATAHNGFNASATLTAKLAVVPPAAAITSFTSGQRFKAGTGPTAISGTALAGARVSVSVDGTARSATMDDAGPATSRWTLTLAAPLGPGRHTVSVVQQVQGVDSAPLTWQLTVDAPPAPTTPTKTAPATTAPAAPAPQGAGPGSAAVVPAGNLASTGARGALPLLAGAAGLLLLGGAALLALRRRKETR